MTLKSRETNIFPPVVFFLLMCCFSILGNAQSAFYKDYTTISATMVKIASANSGIAAIHHLGETTHGNKEILALELTENPSERSDKPVWVFTGGVHGNEQLGAKVVMQLAHELVAGYKSNAQVKNWLSAYDIWIIPTANVWGYENYKRENNIRSGADDSGVDLNRNFDFRWAHGGTSVPGKKGYHGTEPSSERETQILKELYQKLHPTFGITFHQGNKDDGGQIMIPWRINREATAPPDKEVLDKIGRQYADWVFDSRKEGGFCQVNSQGDYRIVDIHGKPCADNDDEARFCKQLCWPPVVTWLGPIGQSSNYFYAAEGTIDFTVELSHRLFNSRALRSANLPLTASDSNRIQIANEIVRNHVFAIKNWFDYFLYSSNGGAHSFRGPGISVQVVDAATGNPLQADVAIEGFESPLVSVRKTDKISGKLIRLLPDTGIYRLIIGARGYKQKRVKVNVAEGALTHLTVQLKT